MIAKYTCGSFTFFGFMYRATGRVGWHMRRTSTGQVLHGGSFTPKQPIMNEDHLASVMQEEWQRICHNRTNVGLINS
jgi:hypothetical protein